MEDEKEGEMHGHKERDRERQRGTGSLLYTASLILGITAEVDQIKHPWYGEAHANSIDIY